MNQFRLAISNKYITFDMTKYGELLRILKKGLLGAILKQADIKPNQ